MVKISRVLAGFLVLFFMTASANSFAQDVLVDAQGETGVGESVETAVDEHEDKKKKREPELPPYIPPPDFAKRKVPQPDLLLRSKKEGWVITGFPAIGWDPDSGFNYGAAAQIYNNGRKDSPFFRFAPYRQSIAVLASYSTKKLFQFQVYYDQPYFMDTPWRIRGEAEVKSNPFKNYFGIGDAGQQLIFPGTGQVFRNYDDYKNALNQQVGGNTNTRYDVYKDQRVTFRGTAEYDLVGGWIRPLFGIQVAHVWVTDYSGDGISGATQLPTHLRVDCDSGAAIGCNGGRDILVKLGISFDTRDFEPDPNKGIFWDVVSELSPKFLGSKYYYGRLNTTFRGYAPIFKIGRQRLTLAGRFFYQWQFGDVPFYSMNTLAFTSRNGTGLGGFASVRGYRLDRFIGPVMMMTNMELRYRFYDFTIWGQNIALGVKPFFDAGRAFSSVSDTSFADWHLGGGGGLMIIWNLATVISLDAAWGSEGNAFYMDIGTQF